MLKISGVPRCGTPEMIREFPGGSLKVEASPLPAKWLQFASNDVLILDSDSKFEGRRV